MIELYDALIPIENVLYVNIVSASVIVYLKGGEKVTFADPGGSLGANAHARQSLEAIRAVMRAHYAETAATGGEGEKGREGL